MKKYNNRVVLLYLLGIISPLSFGIWMALLNNFSVEVVHFSGENMGFLQSIREIPGLLAFTIVFWLLFIRQQSATYIFLILLGFGVAITGYFPSVEGLYITTLIMSFGFHYAETLHSSLSLQWIKKSDAPAVLGKQISLRAFISILSMVVLYIFLKIFHLEYKNIYLIFGSIGIFLVIFAWIKFERFEDYEIQEKKLFLKKEYWLYYILTFFAGARRQIFIVFAAFLLVQKFHFKVEEVVLLFAANKVISMISAPTVGRVVAKIGERLSLQIEYISLIVIFILYGVVQDHYFVVILFILDHILFSMAIALKTYFQKIADPKDFASTGGVSFAINHIAAVFLPAILGLIWDKSYESVFFIGAAIAFVSLLLTFFIKDTSKGYH